MIEGQAARFQRTQVVNKKLQRQSEEQVASKVDNKNVVRKNLY